MRVATESLVPESVADHGNRMSAKHAVVGCGERPADGCANT